jgi:putative copper export protein
MTPDALSVVLQALVFVGLFQAAGVGFFLAIFGQPLTAARNPTRGLGLFSAAVGLILILAHLILDAARMSGDFDGVLDFGLQQLSWVSRSGASQLVQVAGLIIIVLALCRPARMRAGWASLGGVIAVGGFLLTGHTSAHPMRSVLAPLLALHLLIVAFWFGSLLPLAFTLGYESNAVAAQIVNRFSVIASRLVPLILLAGIGMGWLLAGSLAVLRQPYGEMLIAKTAGFALLMLLANYNKWRLARRLDTGAAGPALRRSILAEYLIIVLILSLTAALTTFYSPK